MAAGSVKVLSTSNPRVLLLHAGDYDLLVQGDAPSTYARGWLYSNDPSIQVAQHLSHAIAPSTPDGEPVQQSYFTFHVDSDHSWNADTAGGFAPWPVDDLQAPPQWGPDGLTGWDHLVNALSHPGDTLGSIGDSIASATFPSWLKWAIGGGLFIGLVSVFRR